MYKRLLLFIAVLLYTHIGMDVIENTIAFTDISREECEKSLIPTTGRA